MREPLYSSDPWLLKDLRWQVFLSLSLASYRLSEAVRQRKARQISISQMAMS